MRCAQRDGDYVVGISYNARPPDRDLVLSVQNRLRDDVRNVFCLVIFCDTVLPQLNDYSMGAVASQ